MRLIVTNTNAVERKRLSAVLAAAGHEVAEAADVLGLRAQLGAAVPDALVVDWGLLDPVATLLRCSSLPPYLIATKAQWSPPEIVAAYGHGVEDFMKLPASEAEICGRVEGARRRQRWAARATRNKRSVSTALARIPAWQPVEQVVVGELAAMLGVALVPAPAGPYQGAQISEIHLVVAAEQLDVRLLIEADDDACRLVSARLLGGDASVPAVQDALREMANTAAGALKRAALADGVDFTLGLPSNPPLTASEPGHRRWHARTAAGAALAISLALTTADLRLVPATALREGMIVVRDVLNGTGLLLASAGTLLTRTSAARLAALIGPTLVEIADVLVPAAAVAEIALRS